MNHLLIRCSLALLLPTLGLGQIPSKPSETFSARAEAKVAGRLAATALTIHVERYTTDSEHQVAVAGLKTGGSAGLTAALRHTPSIGYVEEGDRRWPIRYARQEPTPMGRRIVVVLDQPMLLLGGNATDLKPPAGFQLSVILFEVDATGSGQGTMASAARIQAGGPTGVELTNYPDEPITLVTVKKVG